MAYLILPTFSSKGVGRDRMQAVRYYGPDQAFRLEHVERREPGAHEVLVHVTAAGMCHTELHFRSGVLNLGVAPVTMGHEVAGTIVAVGADVAGERVGERVVVYGVGGVGYGLIQLARAQDAHVIAVGRNAAKLAKAKELGAEAVINALDASVADRVRELTDGAGADVIFECVGTAETMAQASAALGRRGRLVFIGYSPDSFTVQPVQLVVFEQQVLGSVGATLQDVYEAVDLVARGVVRTVVDRTLPRAAWETGLNALERGAAVEQAVREARAYLVGAIAHAQAIGAGHSPVDHLFRGLPAI